MKLGISYFKGILIAGIAFISCSKEVVKQPDQITSADALLQPQKISINPRQGFVYTMSNDAGGNSIISYLQSANGTLSYKSTTSSGGLGNGAGLGSQGSLVIDDSHQWLFAVNAGSNSISSFKISSDGSLSLSHTISSNGTLPVSLTVNASRLYVVNSVTSNISGYTIASDGTLTPIAGSTQLLSSANAGPAEIKFTPGGEKLVVTEKNNNKITTYAVDGSGVASSINSQSSAGQTPFGFDFSGSDNIVVTEASGGAPNASTVSSYSVQGTTVLINGPIHAQQTSACWAAVSANGRVAYVTNTSSNTISSFEVDNNGNLKLLNAAEAATGTTPIDITFSDNDFYVYNINSGSHSITEYEKGGNETLKKIGEVTGLPLHAVGIAAF